MRRTPGDDWWVNIWRIRTPVISSLKEICTDVDITGTPSIMRPRGSFDAQHEFCVPSLMSHCPASGCSNVHLAIEWSAAEEDPTIKPCAKISSSGWSKTFLKASPSEFCSRRPPLSWAACSIIHGIGGWDGPISVLKFDSVVLHDVHAALNKMVALLLPSPKCSKMVMLPSLLSLRISWARARMAGSWSHSWWMFDCPTNPPHASQSTFVELLHFLLCNSVFSTLQFLDNFLHSIPDEKGSSSSIRFACVFYLTELDLPPTIVVSEIQTLIATKKKTYSEFFRSNFWIFTKNNLLSSSFQMSSKISTIRMEFFVNLLTSIAQSTFSLTSTLQHWSSNLLFPHFLYVLQRFPAVCFHDEIGTKHKTSMLSQPDCKNETHQQTVSAVFLTNSPSLKKTHAFSNARILAQAPV